MSKAILVIDMPEKCKHCDLYSEDKYSDYICMATLEDVDENGKSKKCPLKPMPRLRVPFNEFDEFALGWNSCIDVIQGDNQ